MQAAKLAADEAAKKKADEEAVERKKVADALKEATDPQAVANFLKAETPHMIREAISSMTAEEYISLAPASLRPVLTNGIQAHNAERENLVKVIVANEANTLTPDQLGSMDVETLRGIASIARGGAVPAPVHNYQGAGLGTPPIHPPSQVQNGETETPLGINRMDFANNLTRLREECFHQTTISRSLNSARSKLL